MISPFSVDAFFPSFRAIQAEFQLNQLQVQQTLTAYMLPFAFMSLAHGPLSDALGRRPIVLVGLSGYVLASLACVFAPDFGSLLLFRAIQGMTAGVGITIGRAVIRDLYEGPSAQRLMSVVSMMFAVAPAVAPVVGGWVHVAFGWRAVFVMLCVLGFALLVCCYLMLQETHPPQRRVAFSVAGLVRISTRIATTPRFALVALAGGINFGSVLAYIGSAPSIVFDQWGLTETQFAHLFVPIICGFLIGAFASGRLAGQMRPNRQVASGFMITALAAAAALLCNLLIDEPPRLAQQLLLTGTVAGIQLVFPPLSLQMLDLFAEARGSVASLQAFVQLIIGAFVMGLVAPLVHGSMLLLAAGSLAAVLFSAVLWRLSLRCVASPRQAIAP
jgi:DHA1 family bicyclomycin/chloramphenicol resistance-like MFS transporter